MSDKQNVFQLGQSMLSRFFSYCWAEGAKKWIQSQISQWNENNKNLLLWMREWVRRKCNVWNGSEQIRHLKIFTALCAFTWSLYETILPQMSHVYKSCAFLNGLFGKCENLCFRRDDDSLKALLHTSHLYGFAPLCTLMWPLILDLLTQTFEQISQVKLRFSSCIVIWALRYFNWAKSLKHLSHLYDVVDVVWVNTWVRNLEKLLYRFWQMKHSLNWRARISWSAVKFLYRSASGSSDSSPESFALTCLRLMSCSRFSIPKQFNCITYLVHRRFPIIDPGGIHFVN